MGKRSVVIFYDDLTGEESDSVQTVSLVGTDGVLYELDLTSANLRKFEKAIEPYREKARRRGKLSAMLNGHAVPVQRSAEQPARPLIDREQSQAVREWWSKNQGREEIPAYVGRGRIPQTVMAAFHLYGGQVIPEKMPRKAGTIGAEFRTAETPITETTKTPRKTVPAAKVSTAEPKSARAATGARGRTAATSRRASAGK